MLPANYHSLVQLAFYGVNPPQSECKDVLNTRNGEARAPEYLGVFSFCNKSRFSKVYLQPTDCTMGLEDVQHGIKHRRHKRNSK